MVFFSQTRAFTGFLGVVNTAASLKQKSSVVFGALRSYDLPDLAASLPQGKLESTGALDAEGHPAK